MTKIKENIERLISKAMDIISPPPGRVFDIEGIPTAITQEHNELFYYWQRFKNATLVHIDAHPDISDNAPYSKRLTKNYYTQLGYTNFICVAIHYGLVSSVYWINPHEAGDVVHDFGSTYGVKGRQWLKTQILQTELDISETIRWGVENPDYVINPLGNSLHGCEKIITLDEIDIDKDSLFILDGDLDGFCCSLEKINSRPESYDGVSGWQERMDETKEKLKRFREPDFIGITRSQGKDTKDKYVPLEKVDEVEKAFISSLKEVYSK